MTRQAAHHLDHPQVFDAAVDDVFSNHFLAMASVLFERIYFNSSPEVIRLVDIEFHGRQTQGGADGDEAVLPTSPPSRFLPGGGTGRFVKAWR